MGVVYSYVVEVVDAFLLKETRTLSTWNEEKRCLRSTVQIRPALYNGLRFIEIVLNLYPETNGEHTCIVTNREPVPAGTAPDPEKPVPKGVLAFFCDLQSMTQVPDHYPELSTWRPSLQYLIDGGNGKAGTFRSEFSVARGLEPEVIQPPLVVIANEQTGDAGPYDFGTCFLGVGSLPQ